MQRAHLLSVIHVRRVHVFEFTCAHSFLSSTGFDPDSDDDDDRRGGHRGGARYVNSGRNTGAMGGSNVSGGQPPFTSSNGGGATADSDDLSRPNFFVSIRVRDMDAVAALRKVNLYR